MPLLPAPHPGALPLHVIPSDRLAAWSAAQAPSRRAWVAAKGFEAGLGETLVLPGSTSSPRPRWR